MSEFVAAEQPRIDGCKQGTLAWDEALELMRALRAYVPSGSTASEALEQRIGAAERRDFLLPRQVQAEVWQRDPWVDLTHQEEFYSSASLRGVKWMGRGPKGRIGTFGYLRSKAISALDLRTERGRVVRARIAAAFAALPDGGEHAVLFVDGVEGSNVLDPLAARTAIEDYGRASGFRWAVYNAYVHNRIPQRFLRTISEAGVPVSYVSIRYASDEHREYLDAFGLPLEPFEYAYPRGGVLAYVVPLSNDDECGFACLPTPWQRLKRWAALNTLWLMVVPVVALGLGAAAAFSSQALIPLALVIGLLLAAHLGYRGKSLRQADKA